MDLGLTGRRALVCGSSAGLGYAIALELAREGCRVALNGRDPERLAAAVNRLERATGARPHGLVADVSAVGAAASLVEQAIEQLGGVDILVANAGGPPAAPFASLPPESWKAAVELNLLSTIHLCRAAVPGMRERRWGRIVCITSVAAKQPMANLILSTTARAGVLGFAKALADEVAPDGVTVNAVCPGYTRTERVEQLLADLSRLHGKPPEQVAAEIEAAIPMRRMADPAELAAAVAFLVSERASYITGVALNVDGGAVRSIL